MHDRQAVQVEILHQPVTRGDLSRRPELLQHLQQGIGWDNGAAACGERLLGPALHRPPQDLAGRGSGKGGLGPALPIADLLKRSQFAVRCIHRRLQLVAACGESLGDEHRDRGRTRRGLVSQHQRRPHAWLLLQHGLQILGVNVQPGGADNHITFAPGEHQIALGVAACQVTGCQPALVVRLTVFAWRQTAISPDLRRDRGSPHQDLPVVP